MTVEVTQDDIDQGRPFTCDNCPVALALLRNLSRLPGVFYVEVSDHTILVLRGKTTHGRFVTPPEATSFIKSFDREEPVEPFRFDLPGFLDGQNNDH